MGGIIYPINDKEYTAEDVEIFNCTRTSGVYSVLDFDYSLSGNVLTVGKGLAWIKNGDFSGKAIAFKDITTITLDSADDTLDRYDVLAVRYDATKAEPEIVVIKGTANESPVMPTRSTESYLYDLFLCSILRKAGESTVSPDNVTDLRKDKKYCGIMEDSVTSAVAPVYETIVENTELQAGDTVDFDYEEYAYLIATVSMTTADCDIVLARTDSMFAGLRSFSGTNSVSNGNSTIWFRAQINLNYNSLIGHEISIAEWRDSPNFGESNNNAKIIKIVGVTKQPKGYVAVDDVYNPGSHNAQSGQAMSRALSGILNASKDYTRIYVEDNLGVVDVTYDPTSDNAQSGKAVAEALVSKQDVLRSGENIKTINGQSILGDGDIVVGENALTTENLVDIDVDTEYGERDVYSANSVNEALKQLVDALDKTNERFKGITPEQTTFFDNTHIVSTNLLDISTMKVGLLHNSDGRVYTGGSYDSYRYFEQYIPVSEGDVISYQWTYNGKRYWTVTDNGANTSISRITAYDKDKNVLGSLGAITSSTNKLLSYTVPETVAFIRVTLDANVEILYRDIAIVKNATGIIPYEEYSESAVLKEEYHNDEHIKKIATEAIEEAPLYKPLAFLTDEICCAVGRTIEIYNSQVCPLADKYHVKWDCSIGRALKRKFSVTGTEALVGEYPLSVCIYDDEFNALYEKTITLKIVQGLSSALSVCTIGDSLTNGKYWLNEVRSLSSNNINFVGTRGTTDGLKHEGRSGFTSNAYLKATSYTFENEGVHPFWDSANNKFSWAYYKTNSGINPDAVQIFLGTNDLAGSMTVETFASNIKQMVDSIREADTAIPIYVVLTICWGNQNGIGIQTSSDGFASQKGRFKYETDCKTIEGVQTLYNTLKKYTNLYFVPLTQCHDSEYNFGNVETPVNPRATQKELMPTEAVHPQKQGYEQIADVMYSVMSAHG